MTDVHTVWCMRKPINVFITMVYIQDTSINALHSNLLKRNQNTRTDVKKMVKKHNNL